MGTLIALLVLMLSAALLFALYLLLRWLLTEMAKLDLFVTFRTEGEIKAVMRGEDCLSYVVRIDNHLIDPDDFDIFKASLDNLTAMVKHFWTISEKHRLNGEVFHEKKLKILEEQPQTGESDDDFEKRMEEAYGQLPVMVRSIERFTEEGKPTWSTEGRKWCILDEEFYTRLVKSNPPEGTWFERLFGVVWVGLPPYEVFQYRFKWLKYAQKESKPSETLSEQTRVLMMPRDEEVDSLYFRYPVYGIIIDDVETGASERLKGVLGGLETVLLRLELVAETETKNPQKTLFRAAGLSSAGDWLSAITKEIRDQVRPWIGTVDYDYVVSQDKKVAERLEQIRGEVNRVAIRDYGQEIARLAFVNVDLKDTNLQKAIDDIFRAEREKRKAVLEAERDIEVAKGKRALAAAPYLGKADGMKQIVAIDDKGSGAIMRVAESFGEGGIKVLDVGGRGLHAMITLPEGILEEPVSPVATSSAPPDSSDRGSS